MVQATSQQEFSDADFRVVDNGDQSKKLAFQVSGVTTATTRTVTIPNASGTMAYVETGTWTPDLGGNATYTKRSGSYTKIGDTVFFEGQVTVNVIGTGSTGTVDGLPYASANGEPLGGGGVTYFASLASSPVFITLIVNNNATTLTFNTLTLPAATITTPGVVFGSGTTIYFHGQYRAA